MQIIRRKESYSSQFFYVGIKNLHTAGGSPVPMEQSVIIFVRKIDHLDRDQKKKGLEHGVLYIDVFKA